MATHEKKIISYYSRTNAIDKMDITTFYNTLSSLVWHIPKHNVQIIGGHMNAQISGIKENFAYTTRKKKMTNI